MENENEIVALIQLLDDNDNEVFKHVQDRLLSYGPEIIPTLERAWHIEINPITHDRLQEIIQRLQFNVVEQKLSVWLLSEEKDLTEALFMVALYFQYDLSLESLQKQITKLRQSIWLELNNNQTVLEQIQTLLHKGALSSNEIENVLHFSSEEIIFALQNLLENDIIFLNTSNKYQLK